MIPIEATTTSALILFGVSSWIGVVSSVNREPSVHIQTDSQIEGQIIGFGDHFVNQYLGIPYATPPVGPLRFQKPQPFRNYPPVFKAVNQPPACPQFTKNPIPGYINSTEKSEDCLFLNIWTPPNIHPRHKKAVMYWIHGGVFRYGSIRDTVYSGVALAALGDIIVVTVNFRVGPFGYLTSGTEDAPGNVGLWDALEGLRWVNKHIEAFGGDTTRITIAGESSGSVTVGLLGVSPLAAGLYRRQIMESKSPTYLSSDNNTQSLAFSQEIAKQLGCANETFTIKDNPKTVIKCLQDVDADVLSEADFLIKPLGVLDFIPQYGDEILPKNPRKSIVDGNFRCAELLIGSNKDEGSLPVTLKYPDIFGYFGAKNPQINKTFGADLIRKAFSAFPDTESIVTHYLPPEDITENDYDAVRHQVYTSIGDQGFVCPCVYHAEKCAEIGGNVYYYFWAHRPSDTPYASWMGVTHFSQVPFTFGKPLLNSSGYEEEEVFISLQLIDIWSSFVRTGKPNLPWPLYSKDKPLFKYLGPGMVTGENGRGPHLENCVFLRSAFGF